MAARPLSQDVAAGISQLTQLTHADVDDNDGDDLHFVEFGIEGDLYDPSVTAQAKPSSSKEKRDDFSQAASAATQSQTQGGLLFC
jgi:hypothetical protein